MVIQTTGVCPKGELLLQAVKTTDRTVVSRTDCFNANESLYIATSSPIGPMLLRLFIHCSLNYEYQYCLPI